MLFVPLFAALPAFRSFPAFPAVPRVDGVVNCLRIQRSNCRIFGPGRPSERS